MPDINWKALQEYRQKEIEEAAMLISDVWKDDKSPDYFRGVMALFSRILQLPTSMCNKDDKEAADEMVAKDFKKAEMDIIRKAVQ